MRQLNHDPVAHRQLSFLTLLSLAWILACGPGSETVPPAPASPPAEPAPEAGGDATAPTATVEEVKAFFADQGKTVLTFTGFSGSGYEDHEAMLAAAGEVLDRHDPQTTLVNIGATIDGIGAVYELAKTRGFTTTGVVSTQAREYDATVSPHVDHVFFIEDATWGGLLEGTDQLSPTSQAMVECGDVFVSLGGGAVSRDELVAARALGKEVEYIAADMNHQKAIDKAARKDQPAPTDFQGPVHAVFGG
ncbi:MAG: hypothetical protein AAF657_06350 [Acidobacteriota bacterium]